MTFSKICILLLVIFSTASAGEFYKYKDASGKWVFSDIKPNMKTEPEKVKYESRKRRNNKPRVYTSRKNDNNLIVVENPFHAPIEVEVYSPLFDKATHRQIISPASTTTIYEGDRDIPSFRYRWILGSPNSRADSYLYQFPVSSRLPHRITQSFNGRFSHSKPPNIYSVDVAMDVGTHISAARGGTVIWTKDDYNMSGKTQYFADKANYVKILHEDGTYAVYAHILEGTVTVKPGDTVDAGDRIARSGSSGFSTGPHLHFVIRRNTGFDTRSVPFKFMGANNTPVVPERGMMVSQ